MTGKIKGARDACYEASGIKSSWETPEERLAGSVSGTAGDEMWGSPAAISVLSTVTDDQEANSDLISKLSVHI